MEPCCRRLLEFSAGRCWRARYRLPYNARCDRSTYYVFGMGWESNHTINYTGYRSALHKKLHKAWGTIFITPPHYKQKKQILTRSQLKLLRRRTKIETVFDYLKQHLHLQTSFPRSMPGYALHYLRVLFGYQLLVLGW